jgi:tripartite-type tricarboxylate transporter receptor subunit TctC
MNRRELIGLGLSSLAAAAAPSALLAQAQYPARPIRLIVPFAPGGVVDVTGRLWADQVKSSLGTVVVENLSGAGGTHGASEAARAEPDGYTVLLGNTSTQVLNPAIMAKPPYDPVAAFRAVSILAHTAISIAVNPSLPPKNLRELIDYINANPGKLSYGSPGAGTFTHLAGEIFKQSTGIKDLVHVPYKGAGPGIADLVSGHIPIMALNITDQVVSLHNAGKLHVLAVLTPERLGVLPDVQTGSETVKGLTAMLFTGLFVPKATSQAIVDRISKATREAMTNEAFKAKLIAAGFAPVLDTPAEAQAFVDAESARLIPVAKSLGFKLG